MSTGNKVLGVLNSLTSGSETGYFGLSCSSGTLKIGNPTSALAEAYHSVPSGCTNIFTAGHWSYFGISMVKASTNPAPPVPINLLATGPDELAVNVFIANLFDPTRNISLRFPLGINASAPDPSLTIKYDSAEIDET